MSIDKNKSALYLTPDQELWQGRPTDPQIGPQYWYQNIQLVDLNDSSKFENIDYAIVGYQCDEGVSRNLGRVGAVEAPNSIRKKLGKLAFHSSKSIADVGDVRCVDGDMESCQDHLADIIERVVNQGIISIAIGGGHDIAFGHFKGLRNAVNKHGDKRIGIINFDAHFDLRPVDQVPNSGTPFHQIFEEYRSEVGYLVVGIQAESNTQQLFQLAKEYGVEYVLNQECHLSNMESIITVVDQFIDRYDYIYLSIDMDGVSSAFAPGVSAPSPMGYDPLFLCYSVGYILKSQKVIGIDIAEVNPQYDIDGITSNLAARLIDYMINI